MKKLQEHKPIWHTVTSNSNLKMETYMVVITLIVCTFYSFYLMRKLKLDREYENNVPL